MMKSSLHVLVVEKKPDIAELMIQQLESQQFLSVTAEVVPDVHEAVYRLKGSLVGGKKMVDCVILDLVPIRGERNEVAAMVIMQQSVPRVPVVVVSDLPIDTYGGTALREGAEAFISKSDYSVSVLIHELRQAVVRHEVRQFIDPMKTKLEGL